MFSLLITLEGEERLHAEDEAALTILALAEKFRKVAWVGGWVGGWGGFRGTTLLSALYGWGGWVGVVVKQPGRIILFHILPGI